MVNPYVNSISHTLKVKKHISSTYSPSCIVKDNFATIVIFTSRIMGAGSITAVVVWGLKTILVPVELRQTSIFFGSCTKAYLPLIK